MPIDFGFKVDYFVLLTNLLVLISFDSPSPYKFWIFPISNIKKISNSILLVQSV